MRAAGSSTAAGSTSRKAEDADSGPAQDKEQRLKRSASLARLQRVHRTMTPTLQGSFSSPGGLQLPKAASQATSSAVQADHMTEGGATAQPSATIMRRSRSGTAAPDMQRIPPDASFRRGGGYPPQRPASSPSQTNLSKALVKSDGLEPHALLGNKQSAAQHVRQQQQLSPFPEKQCQQHDSSQPYQQQLQVQLEQQSGPAQLQQERQQQAREQMHTGAALHEQAAPNSRLRQSGGGAAVAAGHVIEQSEAWYLLPEGLQTMPVQQHLQEQQQQQQDHHWQHQQQQVGHWQQQSHNDAGQQPLPFAPPPPPSTPFSAAAGSTTHSLHSDNTPNATVLHPRQPAHMHGTQVAQGRQVGRPAMHQRPAESHGLWGSPQQPSSVGLQQAMPLQHTPNKRGILWQPHEQHHMASAAAHVGVAAADVDDEQEDALQVQQLSVMPHKPPRQLSGNPFAELPQEVVVTHPVTRQPRHAQQAFQFQYVTSAAGLRQPQEHLSVHSEHRHVHHMVNPGDAEQTASCNHHGKQAAAIHGHCAAQKVAKHGQHAEQTSTKHGHHAEQTSAKHGHRAEQISAAIQDFSQHRGTAQASLQLPANSKSSLPAEAVDSSDDPPIMIHWQADALVAADQTDWALLHDLEVEAVAADEEACLQELQVHILIARHVKLIC